MLHKITYYTRGISDGSLFLIFQVYQLRRDHEMFSTEANYMIQLPTAAIIQLSSASLIKQYVKTANQCRTCKMEVCKTFLIIM